MLKYWWFSQPRLVRFLISAFADGAAVGGLAAIFVLRADFAGLGGLMESGGAFATVLFLWQAGMIAGAVMAAASVFALGEDE